MTVDDFVKMVQRHIKQYYRERYPNLTPPTIMSKVGRKYTKIIIEDNQKSVYCFIETATGNIFKAASWSNPAKGVRATLDTIDESKFPIGHFGSTRWLYQ